jgi:hypothetical protein
MIMRFFHLLTIRTYGMINLTLSHAGKTALL